MSGSGKNRRCPICEAPTKEPFAPFCSDRCKQVDLNRWLSGGYAVPGNMTADDSEGLGTDDSFETSFAGDDFGGDTGNLPSNFPTKTKH